METIIQKHREKINELNGAWIVEDGQIFPPSEIGKRDAFGYSLNRIPRLKCVFVEPETKATNEIKPKKTKK